MRITHNEMLKSVVKAKNPTANYKEDLKSRGYTPFLFSCVGIVELSGSTSSSSTLLSNMSEAKLFTIHQMSCMCTKTRKATLKTSSLGQVVKTSVLHLPKCKSSQKIIGSNLIGSISFFFG